MGVYRAVILVATALVFVVDITQAGVCKGRSTVVQIKIPNRTNVTIQYPNQNGPVEFVPYPYQQPGNSNPPECYTCRGPKCQRCNKVDPNPRYNRPPSYTKTNIIIDLTKDQSDNSNGKDGNDFVKNGTVIILQDKNAASSTSGSSAKGGKGVSASSSASSSITNTDIVASLNEQASVGSSDPGNTEDIYVLDASKSVSASVSSANTGDIPNKDQSQSPKDASVDQPSKQQPAASQQPSVPDTVSPSNQQPDTTSPGNQGSPANQQPSVPDKKLPSDQQSTPDQGSPADQDKPADSNNTPVDQPDDSTKNASAKVEAEVKAKASSNN